MALKRILPDLVIDPTDKERLRRKIESALHDANNAFDSLCEVLHDWGVALSQLSFEDYNEELINRTIDDKIKALDDLGAGVEALIGKGELSYKKMEWNKRRNAALGYVAKVQGIAKAFPKAKVQINGGKLEITNVESIIDNAVGVEPDKDVKEMYRLFCNLSDDFGRLNRFAKEHGYKPFGTTSLVKITSPDVFMDMWIKGYMSEQPDDAQLTRRVALPDNKPRLRQGGQ